MKLANWWNSIEGEDIPRLNISKIRREGFLQYGAIKELLEQLIVYINDREIDKNLVGTYLTSYINEFG